VRIVLLTDTLGDVNGVARFVAQTAVFAPQHGIDLHVLTSTNRAVPQRENIFKIRPRLSAPLPGYAELSVVWPRHRAVRDCVRALAPDIIHVSTPGPMGLLGRKLAPELGVPLVGTYHTDFPQYAERLLGDESLGQLASRVGRWFYAPFDRVLVRSRVYVEPVRALGVEAHRVHALRPGIDTTFFSPRPLPRERRGPINVLYCGRVSVEKGLDLLAPIWALAREQLRARAIDATLTIVGDGPYRASKPKPAAFPRSFRASAALRRSCSTIAPGSSSRHAMRMSGLARSLSFSKMKAAERPWATRRHR
jgi:glycosyltransferase involved in cell wall biosynthesis